MVESELIGYIRKSKKGNAINVSLICKKIETAETFQAKDGEMIGLVINLKNLQEVVSGKREVTNISQIKND